MKKLLFTICCFVAVAGGLFLGHIKPLNADLHYSAKWQRGNCDHVGLAK